MFHIAKKNASNYFQVTGKKLLEKGELKRRYTIIPLNKIASRTLDNGVVRTAKNIVINLSNEAYFHW